MALIECPECRKEVSDKAAFCPHCGLPEPAKKVVNLDEPTTLEKIIAEAIDCEKIQWIGEQFQQPALPYAPNQQTPYTGWMKEMHYNGQIYDLGQYKDGKKHGPGIGWYENGQKKWEETHKDDKIMTAVAWTPKGERCPETNVFNGNGVLIHYNEDGTEESRFTYKDGDFDHNLD